MNIFKTDLFPYVTGVQLQLAAKDVVLTIRSCQLEKFYEPGKGTTQRPILAFTETNKRLILRPPTATAVARLYGAETNEWAGKRVALFAEEVEAYGKTHICVRVRPFVPKVEEQEKQDGTE